MSGRKYCKSESRHTRRCAYGVLGRAVLLTYTAHPAHVCVCCAHACGLCPSQAAPPKPKRLHASHHPVLLLVLGIQQLYASSEHDSLSGSTHLAAPSLTGGCGAASSRCGSRCTSTRSPSRSGAWRAAPRRVRGAATRTSALSGPSQQHPPCTIAQTHRHRSRQRLLARLPAHLAAPHASLPCLPHPCQQPATHTPHTHPPRGKAFPTGSLQTHAPDMF